MTTTETLNSEVDFGIPFIVENGVIRTAGLGLYAPEVFHDDEDDVEILSDEWEALTGYTGQYGYNGAVMHASETLSGGLARDILAENFGVFVVVAVECYPEDENDYPEPAGWAVLRYTGPGGPCCSDPNCTKGECFK